LREEYLEKTRKFLCFFSELQYRLGESKRDLSRIGVCSDLIAHNFMVYRSTLAYIIEPLTEVI